jgi:hypothetical protein
MLSSVCSWRPIAGRDDVASQTQHARMAADSPWLREHLYTVCLAHMPRRVLCVTPQHLHTGSCLTPTALHLNSLCMRCSVPARYSVSALAYFSSWFSDSLLKTSIMSAVILRIRGWKQISNHSNLGACGRPASFLLKYCHVSGVYVTNKTGSGFIDWIYWTFIQLLQQFTNHYLTHCRLLPPWHSTGTLLTSNWIVYCIVIWPRVGPQHRKHPLPSNGYMRTHMENTSCNTGSIVACVYCGRCLEMSLLYCWLSICCGHVHRVVLMQWVSCHCIKLDRITMLSKRCCC